MTGRSAIPAGSKSIPSRERSQHDGRLKLSRGARASSAHAEIYYVAWALPCQYYSRQPPFELHADDWRISSLRWSVTRRDGLRRSRINANRSSGQPAGERRRILLFEPRHVAVAAASLLEIGAFISWPPEWRPRYIATTSAVLRRRPFARQGSGRCFLRRPHVTIVDTPIQPRVVAQRALRRI